MSKKAILGHERTCAICGKEFQMSEGWLYKRSKWHKVFTMCSWPCLQEWDKKYRQHPIKDRRELIIQAIMDGLTSGEIMVLTGEPYDKIERCRKRLEEQNNERKTGGESRSAED